MVLPSWYYRLPVAVMRAEELLFTGVSYHVADGACLSNSWLINLAEHVELWAEPPGQYTAPVWLVGRRLLGDEPLPALPVGAANHPRAAHRVQYYRPWLPFRTPDACGRLPR